MAFDPFGKEKRYLEVLESFTHSRKKAGVVFMMMLLIMGGSGLSIQKSFY